MKTLNNSLPQEDKKKIYFVNFTNAKRVKWDKYRRYGLYPP